MSNLRKNSIELKAPNNSIILMMFTLVIVIVGGGFFFYAYRTTVLQKELISMRKRKAEEIEELKEEKRMILETAFYIKNSAGSYYIRDGAKFENFMLLGTKIILEEMEIFNTPKDNRMSKEKIEQYLEITYTGSNLVSIDPYLSLFIAVVESEGFNTRAISEVGAIGTEQFMPLTAKMLANSRSPWEDLQTNSYSIKMLYDPIESKKLGIRYMKYLLEEFEGRVEWALVGYNAGPTRAKEFWNNGEAIFQDDVPEKYKKYADIVLSQYSRILGGNGNIN